MAVVLKLRPFPIINPNKSSITCLASLSFTIKNS